MAKTTGIAWTRSTRNLWAGCTKVGPGCDGCYAEAFQRWVQGKDPESGEAKNWGPGRQRLPYLVGAFKDLRKWNRDALAEFRAGVEWASTPYARMPTSVPRRPFWPVFLNTQSDFFDNEAPQEWRDASYPVIEECSNLTIYLVTKRVGNVAKMVPAHWLRDGFPDHVRLLVTVVNQDEAHRDIPKLLALPCKNGISYEPALERVDWSLYLKERNWRADGATLYPGIVPGRRLEWIIVGGESAQSGHKARPFDIGWARSTIAPCRSAGVPVFVKQLGGYCIGDANDIRNPRLHGDTPMIFNERGALARFRFKDDAGADPAEWPDDLRVQEFPA